MTGLGTEDLSNLASLRMMLVDMEAERGLSQLRPIEKDILYALHILSNSRDDAVRSEAIKSHVLCQEIPPASFHRTLKTLIERGFVRPAPHRKTGAYLRG